MKTMENGNSLLQNTAELIADLNDKEHKRFENTPRRKSEAVEAKTITLFKKLLTELNSGKAPDELDRIELEEWCLKNELTPSLNDLLRELYEAILRFLGEAFETKEDRTWQREVESALFQVQALMSRKMHSQAGMLIKKLEKKIPKLDSSFDWDDFSMLIKLAQLKIAIGRNVGFVKASASDRFLWSIYSNAQVYSRGYYDNRHEGAEEFKQYSDKFFFLQMYFQSIQSTEDWSEEKEFLNQMIDTVPQRNKSAPNLAGNPLSYFTSNPNEYLETWFWRLHGYQRALEFGQYEAARSFLNTSESYTDQDEKVAIIELALIAWMSSLTDEAALNEFFNTDSLSSPTLSESLSLYTVDTIQYLPLRLEFNRLLLLLSINQFDRAHTALAQINQLPNLPYQFKTDLSLIEVTLLLVQSIPRGAERAKSVYNGIRSKKGLEFEIALAKLLDNISSLTRRAWKDRIAKKEIKHFEKMQERADPKKPMHQFYLRWITDILNGK